MESSANLNALIAVLHSFANPVLLDTGVLNVFQNDCSLMKMVVNFAKTDGVLTQNHLEHSIRRNFGGFDPAEFNPMATFDRLCSPPISSLKKTGDRPPTDPIGLIKSSLSGNETALQGCA